MPQVYKKYFTLVGHPHLHAGEVILLSESLQDKMRDILREESVNLKPTQFLYLQPFRRSVAAPVIDLTDHLQQLFDGRDITPDLQDHARRVLQVTTTLEEVWHLRRTRHALYTQVTITKPNMTTELASMTSHLLSYGASHIRFLSYSPANVHDITVKPISVLTRSQIFVMDSTQFVWARSHSGLSRSDRTGMLSLYKEVNRSKVEIGRYSSANSKFDIGGLLVLDEAEISPIPAILTLLGVLTQVDAFYMPGLDLPTIFSRK